MSELHGDWCWHVSNEVLQHSGGYVVIHQGPLGGGSSLGKLHGDWSWHVSNQVLQHSGGDVVVHQSPLRFDIGLSVDIRIELDETLGDWGIGVSDKVNESLLGDVLSVKLSNKSGWVWHLVLPVGNLVIWAVVIVIIRESLIKSLGQGLLSVVWISERNWRSVLWDSLDHHGDGDVVVIRWILLLISVLLEDGVEGIVSDDLSETLESNRLNSVKVVGWGNLEGDGLDLIDWDIDWHGVLVEVLSLGLDKVG